MGSESDESVKNDDSDASDKAETNSSDEDVPLVKNKKKASPKKSHKKAGKKAKSPKKKSKKHAKAKGKESAKKLSVSFDIVERDPLEENKSEPEEYEVSFS